MVMRRALGRTDNVGTDMKLAIVGHGRFRTETTGQQRDNGWEAIEEARRVAYLLSPKRNSSHSFNFRIQVGGNKELKNNWQGDKEKPGRTIPKLSNANHPHLYASRNATVR